MTMKRLRLPDICLQIEESVVLVLTLGESMKALDGY